MIKIKNCLFFSSYSIIVNDSILNQNQQQSSTSCFSKICCQNHHREQQIIQNCCVCCCQNIKLTTSHNHHSCCCRSLISDVDVNGQPQQTLMTTTTDSKINATVFKCNNIDVDDDGDIVANNIIPILKTSLINEKQLSTTTTTNIDQHRSMSSSSSPLFFNDEILDLKHLSTTTILNNDVMTELDNCQQPQSMNVINPSNTITTTATNTIAINNEQNANDLNLSKNFTTKINNENFKTIKLAIRRRRSQQMKLPSVTATTTPTTTTTIERKQNNLSNFLQNKQSLIKENGNSLIIDGNSHQRPQHYHQQHRYRRQRHKTRGKNIELMMMKTDNEKTSSTSTTTTITTVDMNDFDILKVLGTGAYGKVCFDCLMLLFLTL